MIFDTITLCEQLIALPSLTPKDAGCQELLAERLQHLGFSTTSIPAGPVENLWAVYGDSGPLFAFAGHTDVVPEGNREHWQYPPFTPTQADDYLYGRGSQDMKGNLAAMVHACHQFLANNKNPNGRIGFIITSAEEGSDYANGTPKVLEYLEQNKIDLTWCVVGEPSSKNQTGDLIRIGRRGSISGYLTIHGTQGHVAYAHLADNPVHRASSALAEFVNIQWDQGNKHFPATSMQIANINAGTGATNVIPGDLNVQFNFRFSSELSAATIKEKVTAHFDKHELNYTLEWEHSGDPFLTDANCDLVQHTQAIVKEEYNLSTELSTGGGTSDGRFIAKQCEQLIELGCCNDTIHKVNERVRIEDLHNVALIYQRLLQRCIGQ